MNHLITMATTTDEQERNARVALLPIGSFEQHGPYLPLSTDTIVACAIANAIAERYPVMLLPPITISCSHEHAAWRGTVSISARTLHQLVTDIADSLRLNGVDRLVLVNGHGGNYVLRNIVQEASVNKPKLALFPSSTDWQIAQQAAGMTTSSHEDVHGGEIESSILLHAHPCAVRPGNETADWMANDRPHLLSLGMTAYTESGIIGRPSLATAIKGSTLLSTFVTRFDTVYSMLTSIIYDSSKT